MPTSFTSPTVSTLFFALFLLALAPNLSVMIVTTRAATAGFRQGLWATLGIVAATSVYLIAAVFFLLIVSDMRPETRHVLRLLAAVYLMFTGMGMVRNAAQAPRASLPVTHRAAASFATGFLLSILNLKSLLFYVALLPAFVKVGGFNLRDTLTLVGVGAAAAAAAKLGYALASSGGRVVPSVAVGKALNILAGVVTAASGFVLASGRIVRF